MVARALGHHPGHSLYFTTPLVWIIAGVTDLVGRISGQPVYLNLDKTREVTAGSWTCSPQRAVDELGFSVAAPLIDRLRETVEWYRKQGWL